MGIFVKVDDYNDALTSFNNTVDDAGALVQ